VNPGEPSALRERDAVLRFMLAGNATFTLVSVGTGTRFTFKVRRPKEQKGMRDVLFVSLLTGPRNEGDFTFLGTLFMTDPSRGTFVCGKKIHQSAAGSRAFRWFWARLMCGDDPTPVAEFWHEGKCGKCARKLTVPESLACGIGPECRS
jgi:hypothetical protein